MAKTVELDTPEAHIIVIRPLDQWGGAEKSDPADDFSLNLFIKKKYNLSYFDTTLDKRISTATSIFSEDNKSGYFAKIYEKYPTRSVSLNGGRFVVEKPIESKPLDFAKLLNAQNSFFKYSVILQGDPSTLQDRTSNKKLLGNILGIATIGISAIPAVNALGYNAGVGSVFTQNVADLPMGLSPAIVGVPLPATDLSKYQEIDIRKASGSGLAGQIIIAYKGQKTQEAEDSAMLLALPALMSFDESISEIQTSRASDYEYRKVIWDDCLKSGECKTEN